MATPDHHGGSAPAFWETLPDLPRLSNQDWQRIEHLFGCTDAKRGRPRRSEREIVEAILWVEQNHYKWHWLPADYPPAQTCYTKYVAWRRDGLLDRIKSLLKDASLDARTYE